MTDTTLADWQHLKPYGYAPGGYMSRCRDCGDTPIMDKRAWRCRTCAEAAHANGQAQREQEAEAAIDAEEGPLLVAARKVISGSQSVDSCHGGYVVPAELWLALQGEVMEQLREHASRALAPTPAAQPDPTRMAVLRACDEALSAVPDDKPIRDEWDRGFREGLKCIVTVVRAALHKP